MAELRVLPPVHKFLKKIKDKKLDDLSTEALTQIEDKQYDAEMREDGIMDILKLGIAFSGKNVKIKAESI